MCNRVAKKVLKRSQKGQIRNGKEDYGNKQRVWGMENGKPLGEDGVRSPPHQVDMVGVNSFNIIYLK